MSRCDVCYSLENMDRTLSHCPSFWERCLFWLLFGISDGGVLGLAISDIIVGLAISDIIGVRYVITQFLDLFEKILNDKFGYILNLDVIAFSGTHSMCVCVQSHSLPFFFFTDCSGFFDI